MSGVFDDLGQAWPAEVRFELAKAALAGGYHLETLVEKLAALEFWILGPDAPAPIEADQSDDAAEHASDREPAAAAGVLAAGAAAADVPDNAEGGGRPAGLRGTSLADLESRPVNELARIFRTTPAAIYNRRSVLRARAAQPAQTQTTQGGPDVRRA